MVSAVEGDVHDGMRECGKGKMGRERGLIFFKTEDGIRDIVRSRVLGDEDKKQAKGLLEAVDVADVYLGNGVSELIVMTMQACLLYTSHGADD